MRPLITKILFLLFVFGAPSRPVEAGEGGASNYLPGAYGSFAVALAPAPGFYLQNDLFFYNGHADRTVLSGAIGITLELDLVIDLVTALWAPDFKVLGAQYATAIFVPLIDADLTGSFTGPVGNTFSISTDRYGLGDIGLVPVSLYWTLSEKCHANLFHAIVFPTGSYTTSRFLNVGRNYYSFDTVLALTYFDAEKGRELSFVPGVMVNTKNSATNYHTGTEFHVDAMLNQFFSKTLAIGIHGFYYHQLTGDSGTGARLGDFKGRAVAVGPSLMWVPVINGKPVRVVARWWREFSVKRRFEGNQGQVQFGFQF